MKNKFLILTFLAFLFVGFGLTANAQDVSDTLNVVSDTTAVVLDSVSTDSTTVVTNPTDGTDTGDSNKLWTALLTLVLPGIIGSIAVLFADASKHFSTPNWSWSVFFSTKIKPFLLVNGISLGVVLVAVFLPDLFPYLERLAGFDLGNDPNLIEWGAIVAFATAVIDGFSKKKPQ